LLVISRSYFGKFVFRSRILPLIFDFGTGVPVQIWCFPFFFWSTCLDPTSVFLAALGSAGHNLAAAQQASIFNTPPAAVFFVQIFGPCVSGLISAEVCPVSSSCTRAQFFCPPVFRSVSPGQVLRRLLSVFRCPHLVVAHGLLDPRN
jgi:hypothetical protein